MKSRASLPLSSFFTLCLLPLFALHFLQRPVESTWDHDSFLNSFLEGFDDDDEGVEEDTTNMTLREKFNKHTRDGLKEDVCCKTCVQPFDWYASPGNIDCGEEFGKERKCKGSCMMLIVKHVAERGGERKKAMTPTTTIVGEASAREQPFLWRFCTKKPKVRERGVRAGGKAWVGSNQENSIFVVEGVIERLG